MHPATRPQASSIGNTLRTVGHSFQSVPRVLFASILKMVNTEAIVSIPSAENMHTYLVGG